MVCFAVDFCQPAREEHDSSAGALPVVTVRSDILHYSSWGGQASDPNVCTGDTLTYLSSPAEAVLLIRRCFQELDHGGRLILTLRDNSENRTVR